MLSASLTVPFLHAVEVGQVELEENAKSEATTRE